MIRYQFQQFEIFSGLNVYTKMQTFGSRAEVFHGTAMKTTGGLTKSDLTQDKYGAIISKAAQIRIGQNEIGRETTLG